MFTDVQDESFNEIKTKFESFNGGTKVGPVDLEVQVILSANRGLLLGFE